MHDLLDRFPAQPRIQRIVHQGPLALVISKDQACPEDLRISAEETQTPLWSSPKRGHELLNHLQYHLARTLAPRVTLHGVFMEVYSIGVLVTGEPVDLVFAMTVPEHFTQQHLQLLSELAEVFAEPAFRQSLRAAPDTASLYAALQRGRG